MCMHSCARVYADCHKHIGSAATVPLITAQLTVPSKVQEGSMTYARNVYPYLQVQHSRRSLWVVGNCLT